MPRQHDSTAPKRLKRNLWADTAKRLAHNKLAMISLFFILAVIFMAIFADWIAPYDYAKQDLRNAMQLPSAEHLLGTDNYGRDIFSRIVYGGRISLLVSVIAVGLSLVAGSLVGATAGYFGGTYENIVMRIVDMLMAIPTFLMAVVIAAALGTGIINSAIAIAVGMLPGSARIMRSTVLQIREQEYVEAARAAGASNARIIFGEILPNALAPLIVDTTLRIGAAMIQISSLSFVGLGVPAPLPEWGSMLNSGREFIRSFWPMTTFPGIAIIVTLISFNLLGDGLRDALDPRLKQ